MPDRPFPTVRSLSTAATTFDRRRMLRLSGAGTLGLLAGPSLLAACGGSSSGESASGEISAQLVPLFNPSRVIAAGIPQRLPFGLVDNGIRLTGDGEAIRARIELDGDVIDELDAVGRVVAHEHPEGTEEHQHSGLLRYYALRTTLPQPGIYDVTFEINGNTAGAPVQAFATDEIDVLLPGDEFPAVLDTPTLDDARGIDPICTQPNGPCEFHQQTATEIVAAGRPMALLVATPAYCVTAYCGPVLDTLIEAMPAAPHVRAVHLEPYANAAEVGGDLTSGDLQLAPMLDPLGLTYEPVLFLVGSDGRLVDRIDNVFDLSELEPALASLS